jgi:hypothetical protein
MCNLYSMTKTQDAIRDLFDIKLDSTGNLRSFPAIFPDNEAPVIRNTSGGRELRLMRWGFPPPPKGYLPVTNIRNVSSPFWRAWMRPEYRCLVPAGPVRLCGPVAPVDRCPRHQEGSDRGRPPALFVSDHRAERRGQADPRQSYAGYPPPGRLGDLAHR